MKRSGNPTRLLAAGGLLFLLLIRLAPAYLEPGSTSFLLKILIAGLTGILLVYRGFWKSLRHLISKLTSRRRKQD